MKALAMKVLAARKAKLLAAALLACAPVAAHAQQPQAIVAKLRTLASAGSPAIRGEAHYHLGMAYHLGLGVAQDAKKALAEFRAAADLGDPLGAYKIGCYYDGQGEGLVEADAAQALRWKLVAAQAGYALAQQDVAAIYARAGDTKTADEWIARAALQGWPEAMAAHASLNNGRNGLPRDDVIVAAWFNLFLNRAQRVTDEQRETLKQLIADLSPEQRAKAEAIVGGFKPAPSPLTIKGLAGFASAEKLVSAAP
jgi:TPR repeat protein